MEVDIEFEGVYHPDVFGCFHDNIGYASSTNPEASDYRNYEPRLSGSCRFLDPSRTRITINDHDYLGLIENGFVNDPQNWFLYTRDEEMFAPHLVLEPISIMSELTYSSYDDQSESDKDFSIAGVDVYRTPSQMDVYIHFNAIVDLPTFNLNNMRLSIANKLRTFEPANPTIQNPGRYGQTAHIRLSDSDITGIVNERVCLTLEECFVDFNSSNFVNVHTGRDDIRVYDIDNRSPPGRYNTFYDPVDFGELLNGILFILLNILCVFC